MLKYKGLGLEQMNFEGDVIQSITDAYMDRFQKTYPSLVHILMVDARYVHHQVLDMFLGISFFCLFNSNE